MDFTVTTCKICNQEHTVIAKNTDDLWKKLCMLCKHETIRTNRFLALLEKSSAFLLLKACSVESADKMEPKGRMVGNMARLWIDSDKIFLGPEPPSASSFIENNYSSYQQNTPPMDIEIENSDNIILGPELPSASPFKDSIDRYSKKKYTPIDIKIEYHDVKEEISSVDDCIGGNTFAAHNCDENQENLNKVEPLDNKVFLPEFEEFPYTQLENGTFKCNICGVTQQNKRLKEHIMTHTGEKPYECKICQKSFLKKITLIRHSLIHTGEKPFECSECLKKFNDRGNLKKHMVIHTGERLYKCHDCSKEFKAKGDLKGHMKVHSNERPFECEICSKKFKNMKDQRKHKLLHATVAPYQCNICMKGFVRGYLFRDHMKTHTLQ